MKEIQRLSVALVTLFYAGVGIAGSSVDGPVQIDTELRSAQGVQTTARFSDNEVEAIGCGARVTDAGDGNIVSFGFCQATNADNMSVFCATFSPELIDAINGIANYGFISFTWNEQEECTSVRNSTQSIYIPDFRDKKSKKTE